MFSEGDHTGPVKLLRDSVRVLGLLKNATAQESLQGDQTLGSMFHGQLHAGTDLPSSNPHVGERSFANRTGRLWALKAERTKLST